MVLPLPVCADFSKGWILVFRMCFSCLQCQVHLNFFQEKIIVSGYLSMGAPWFPSRVNLSLSGCLSHGCTSISLTLNIQATYFTLVSVGDDSRTIWYPPPLVKFCIARELKFHCVNSLLLMLQLEQWANSAPISLTVMCTKHQELMMLVWLWWWLVCCHTLVVLLKLPDY